VAEDSGGLDSSLQRNSPRRQTQYVAYPTDPRPAAGCAGWAIAPASCLYAAISHASCSQRLTSSSMSASECSSR